MTNQSSETDSEQRFAKDKGYVMYMQPQNHDVITLCGYDIVRTRSCVRNRTYEIVRTKSCVRNRA